ncbi:MAG TPA: AsmA-like C-terminal region-containing protein, partial [Ottowia sp.]|nr:AsmA-like C-terminal region-containing protein [Ottowia sp.]
FGLERLAGTMDVSVGPGQLLDLDPGAGRVFGLFALRALPRRLTLDFRDVFSQGFAFDFVRGDVAVQHGVARTSNLQMKGASAAVLMDGSADLARETQDLRVLVVPEIDAGTAALVATAINPAIGISAFLAQLILQRPLAKAATREFRLTGSWDEPKVTPVAAGSAGALQPALPAESASAAPAARNPAPAPEPEAAGSGAAPAPPRTVEEPS